jgi:hypothetical protein
MRSAGDIEQQLAAEREKVQELAYMLRSITDRKEIRANLTASQIKGIEEILA